MSRSCSICHPSGPHGNARCALSATPGPDPKPIENSRSLFTRLIGLGSQFSYQKEYFACSSVCDRQVGFGCFMRKGSELQLD